jgi:autotransporter-associated beta strand protein
MALHSSTWRRAISTLGVLAAIACVSQVAFGQYNWVQATGSTATWSDTTKWTGGAAGTYPNAVGATATLQNPTRTGSGLLTITMPATDTTVGEIHFTNQSGFAYGTRTTLANAGGKLIFQASSGNAKWTEDLNTATAPQNIQNQIQTVVQLNSDLEINQNNYQNLNTGTIFTNRIDGSASRTIIKKGVGGIQFNASAALNTGEGFFGQILLQEGSIRTINSTVTLSTVSGITVSAGGQLQLADNAAVPVSDYNLASGAVLNINGDGTLAVGSSGPQGALRFGIATAHTMTFHNPVVLQSNSTISEGGLGAEGVLDNVVSGAFTLTKQGDGKLTITNPASGWGGDTRILSGPTTGISTLSITNPILATGKDVYVSATRTALDLNFSGTNTVHALYLDNSAQAAGTYGAVGSSDPNDIEVAWITGTGQLIVSTQPTPGVPGDFNNNGVVDAADYVLWRKGGNLQNEISAPGTVNGQDYLDWKGRFGAISGSGTSLGGSTIPEPAAWILLASIVPLMGRRSVGRTRS